MNHRSLFLALLLGAAAAVGCKSAASHENEPRGSREMWVGRAIDTMLVDQAVIAQRTLYPYHFRTASAELNDLGHRDLGVLAAHYAQTPGRLQLRRGDSSDELYSARVAKVADALAKAGIEPSSVKIEDGLPGGDGRTTEQVLVILSKTQSLGDISTTGGGSSGSSAGAGTQ